MRSSPSPVRPVATAATCSTDPPAAPCAPSGALFFFMTTQTKICSKCGEEKPLDAFYASKTGKYGRSSWCKKCANNYATAKARSAGGRAYRRRADATPKGKVRTKRNRLSRHYGISLSVYLAQMRAQNGLCFICRRVFKDDGSNPAVVDHCHKTGRLRALLCHSCNRGLGFFRDDPKLLSAAEGYMHNVMNVPASVNWPFRGLTVPTKQIDPFA